MGSSDILMKNNPRGLAVNILNRIDERNAYAEPLLDAYLSRDLITNIHDRRLLTQLVYGTLRMRNHLDWIIRSLYKGDVKSMEKGLKNILRTALYQIMYTDRIPVFAAVNEAVKITKHDYPGRAGLVNAILRNALRKKDHIQYPDPVNETALHISVVHSHPEWMVQRWIARFGVDETKALCQSNNGIPPLTVRVNTTKGTRDQIMMKLRDEGIDAKPTHYSTSGIILFNPSLPLKSISLYREGYIQVQDEASQLVSYLVNPAPGEKILDLCAGVGVKTTHMAELMGNEGTIIAVDISRGKETLRQDLSQRLGISIIESLTGDASEDLGHNFHGSLDRILIDAPCSGTGTLRRNPEIKWRIQEKTIKKVTILQKKILHSAARYPKKGGVIVYCTCSIEAEENEEVIRDFLAHHPDYECIIPHETVHPDTINKTGFFAPAPHRHGTDGFFGAVLKRK